MELGLFIRSFVQTHAVRTYLEIGTRDGDSLRRVVSDNPNLVEVVVADMWGGLYGGTSRHSHDHISRLLEDLEYKNKVTYLDGDSKVTIPTLGSAYLDHFDLVLVDGDHSYEGGMADLTNVFPLCASGGCILFHDICHPAHRYLTACFDEFVDRYKNEIAESLKITDELGIGVIVKKSLADRKEQEHRDRYARLRCRD